MSRVRVAIALLLFTATSLFGAGHDLSPIGFVPATGDRALIASNGKGS
jgi:hypothetical protein